MIPLIVTDATGGGRDTKAVVTSVEARDDAGDEPRWDLRVERWAAGWRCLGRLPDSRDLPDDVRAALLEWLTQGNNPGE